METKRRNRLLRGLRYQLWRIFYIIFTLADVFLIVLVFIALGRVSELQKDLKANTIVNCQEIEELKKGERKKVWDEFNDLDKNLKLLHLKKTPEIVAASKRRRNRELSRYAKDPCPRKPIST